MFDVLSVRNIKFEIHYGDGTFSLSIPKGESKSAKRTFARVGLLSVADKNVYLDSIYKDIDDAIPSGAIPWRRNDPTQYVFRIKNLEDFEKVKKSIREGLIKSYNILSTIEVR
jgi:hypothetical protein